MSTTIAQVPELCNLTGLKDVAQFTWVTPTQRQEVSWTDKENL